MVRTLPARGSGAAATTCPRGVRGVVDHPHGQLRSLATPLDDRLLLCLNVCVTSFFCVFLASEKFPPRLRGEEGFKHARGAHNTHRRRLKLR